jgi:hypothetical protein
MSLENQNLKTPIPAYLCFDLPSAKVDIIKRVPHLYQTSPAVIDITNAIDISDHMLERVPLIDED